jgi:hypothetical protein
MINPYSYLVYEREKSGNTTDQNIRRDNSHTSRKPIYYYTVFVEIHCVVMET